MLWGENRGKWKSRQPPGVEPRTPLAWAASALPLSHDSRTTTNPHNLLCIEDCEGCQMCDWGIQYRGIVRVVVVRLSWLSGRALAAQARGVLGSTPSDCRLFHFSLFSPHNIYYFQCEARCFQILVSDKETLPNMLWILRTRRSYYFG